MPVKISIVTACFNSAATVGAAAESALGQSPKPEYIVVDGASTDGTLAALEKRRGDISRLISEKDGGMYFALNKGIGAASGDAVGFLHADDVYAGPGALAAVAETFAASGADAVYGDLAYVRGDGSLLRYWRAGAYSRGSFRRGWMPPHPALFLKRAVYERLGLFDTSYRIAADYEFMVRALYRHAVKAVYLPRLLVRMRAGGMSNRGLGNILLKSREDYRVIRGYGLGGVGTLAMKNLAKLPQFFAGE